MDIYKKNSLNAELTALLQCPICCELITPPIRQCQFGHLLCNDCRSRVCICPICKGSLAGNIRNLCIEKLMRIHLWMPCKFKDGGCTLMLKLEDKRTHEEACTFRFYCCPYPKSNCLWRGKLHQIWYHIRQVHSNVVVLSGPQVLFTTENVHETAPCSWVMIQECYGKRFLLSLEKRKFNGSSKFVAEVQLIGTKEEAKHFMCSLQLNGLKRRLLWEYGPRSCEEGFNTELFHDRFDLDSTMARYFTEDGKLKIAVTIRLVC